MMTRLAMISVAVVLVWTGCEQSIDAGNYCGPLTCGGCCQGNKCEPGNNALACGLGGVACSACVAPLVCGPTAGCGSPPRNTPVDSSGTGVDSGGMDGTSGGTGGSSGGGNGSTGGGNTGPSKRVFVTSTTYSGNFAGTPGARNGLDGADILCNAAAAVGGLGGTWRAWLSDQGQTALGRIVGNGPWHKLDAERTLAFRNRENLSTTPFSPLDIDENGNKSGSGIVWTGTATGGGASGSNCRGWTRNDSGADGSYGVVEGNRDSEWTESTTASCFSSGRLYCLEQ
jgi:hypothetical protein